MTQSIKKLLILVNNYAIRLFDEVERAKIGALFAAETRRIGSCLLETLERSGLVVDDIDAVVRTGGSAQIPRFIEMLERIFGPEKVVLSEVFSGVRPGWLCGRGRARGNGQVAV
jgi:molecular chaperone DnaK (HSP70)